MPDASHGPVEEHTCVCPWWLIYAFDNPIRKLFQPPARMLAPLVRAGDGCLDIGCGMGYFTVPLAQLVGPAGRVTAVDLQTRMLRGVARRAARRGVGGRIALSRPEDPDWKRPAQYDFILVFWMLHEVPDRAALLRTLHEVRKPGARLLLVEPKGHVRRRQWEESLGLAKAAGFACGVGPAVAFSRTALLQ